jgi:hypothetical protein
MAVWATSKPPGAPARGQPACAIQQMAAPSGPIANERPTTVRKKQFADRQQDSLGGRIPVMGRAEGTNGVSRCSSAAGWDWTYGRPKVSAIKDALNSSRARGRAWAT